MQVALARQESSIFAQQICAQVRRLDARKVFEAVSFFPLQRGGDELQCPAGGNFKRKSKSSHSQDAKHIITILPACMHKLR